jgi:hypothetical protein
MTSRSASEWESTLTTWSQPLGKVEDEKAQRAITAIERAVANSAALADKYVQPFVQGSYLNKTGVRQESDVDVCVLSRRTFHMNSIPAPHTRASLGISDATYDFNQLRSDVEAALVAGFGRAAVKNGNKAFNVRENTYRVEADVVPCFEYRHYLVEYGQLKYEEGTCLIARDGTFITNFPMQQHRNGLRKDESTHYRFKPMVRAVKKLCCEMADEGIGAAKPMKSFLLESLVWNVSDDTFTAPSVRQRVNDVLYIIEVMTGYDKGASYKEENGIKPLFSIASGWTPQQAADFASAARKYLGTA